jgi:hypothetical protein
MVPRSMGADLEQRLARVRQAVIVGERGVDQLRQCRDRGAGRHRIGGVGGD